MGALLLTTVIQELPGIIAMFKARFAVDNPGAPPLTDEQVKAALSAAILSSVLVDDAWLAAHPKGLTGDGDVS